MSHEDARRKIDREFLLGLEVDEEVVDKSLLVLRKSEVLNVASLLAFSSEDRLRNLKAKNERGEEVNLGEGTIAVIWKYIEDNRGKAVGPRGTEFLTPAAPMRSTTPVADAMRTFLKKVSFPSSATAYEFPDLVLPPDNKYAQSSLQAGVKQDWASDELKPDFLVTALDKRLTSLEEFRWNSEKRRLSRSGLAPGSANLNLPHGKESMTCLVAASGTGKTRYLFESCFQEFGAYITAARGPNQPGSEDLPGFLGSLPINPGTDIDAMRTRLMDGMNRFLLARALVLEKAIATCKANGNELLPRHWLALQLFPGKFCMMEVDAGKKNIDVFEDVVKATSGVELSMGEASFVWRRSNLCFVALDEAQRVDLLYPNMFPSERGGPTKRSALSALVASLRLLGTNVILSGTGLGIQSAYETMTSGMAKEGLSARLLGITTFLTSSDVTAALRMRGVTEDVDADTLELFAGRPRFAMRLAAGLLLGQKPDVVACAIVADIRLNMFPKLKNKYTGPPQTGKTVYGEVRRAAQKWSLRGLGAITREGEVALELGVGAIEARGEMSSTEFVIKEPLVVQAFDDLATAEFEGISDEDDIAIGSMLEDYVAFNAEGILGIFAPKYLPVSIEYSKFLGPWKLARLCGSQRRGFSPGNGDEPQAIREILNNADGGKGMSMIFPGTLMGADVVLAAKRETDDRKLLVFIQIKASMHASGADAMRSLTMPYHTNRDGRGKSKPNVPDNLNTAHSELNSIITDPHTSVVFLVFKYPGNVKAKKMDVHKYNGTNVLHVYIDGKNGETLLPEMTKGFEVLRNVKRLRS